MDVTKILKTITEENIHRIAEQVLEDVLETLSEDGLESSEVYALVNAELDRRAGQFLEQKLKKDEKTAAEINRQLELTAELESLLQSNNKRVVMVAMVNEFGHEFSSDYEIIYLDNGHIKIVSHATNPHQPDEVKEWVLLDEAAFTKKYKDLLYYRIYNRYFRDDILNESLARLQMAIATELEK